MTPIVSTISIGSRSLPMTVRCGTRLAPVVPDEVRVLDTASSGTLVKSWVLTFQTGSHGRSAMLSNGPPGAMESDERIVRTLPSSPGGVR